MFVSLDPFWELTSDAWLRVVKVVDNVGGATIAEYKYNGLHHRTVKLKPNGTNWDRRDYYYSCAWQVVEERELLNTLSKTTVATVPKFQWVWGTRYIDEVILRDENKDGDSDCVDGTDQRLYYAQDANSNVTAIINTAGTVVERVLYDAYGKSTLYNAAWSVTQASTLYNNEVLYAGYRLDPESGLYQVRHRHYHPTLGRWVQKDPIGYYDSMNPFEYVVGNPIAYRDPSGLAFYDYGSEKVDHDVHSKDPKAYGNTKVLFYIKGRCDPCKDANGNDCWESKLIIFDVRVKSYVRTKYYDQWTNSEGSVPFDRTKENIERTEKHEEKHRKQAEEWHDKNRPQAKADFKSECIYGVVEACKDSVELKEKEWNARFDEWSDMEETHDPELWPGYKPPPRERK